MDRRGIPSGRLHSKSTTDPKWMTESLYAESFRRQKRRGKSSSDASMFELAPSEFMSRCSSSAIDNESFRSTRDHLSRNSSQRSSSRIPTGQGEGQMFPRRYGSQGGDSEMLGASQREIPDDSSSRNIFINDPDRTNSEYVFAGNKIRTSKYSVLTFLPRNLFEQFHRVAYIYFLILIILNQLPWLAVFSSVTSALPLAFVLLVTAVKDGYEDWRRHRSDKNENNREAEVWGAGGFQPKTWKDIRVGEVIRIKSNETLPCDVVLLSTSDPSGVAYVQTINLDGESNLKIRYAKQETVSRMKEGENPIGATIRCEQPNRNIYKFLANIEIEGKKVSLGPANVVLRGCELKNTSWAIGVAIYAGQETKVMLNSSGAPSKRSRLENYMNDEVLYLVLFLIIMCTVAGIGSGVWLGQHKDELNTLPYYRKRYFNSESNKPYNYYGIAAEIVFAVLTAVIIFQIMVPIALYISMELVRVGQAYFMIRDKRMYDETTKSKFQCRALNINEDLGQIKYVFSDKTGTLTENKMEFHDASVFGKNYSISKIKISTDEEIQQILHHVTDEVDGKLIKPKMEVKVDPSLLQLLKQEEITEEKKFAHDFFLTLAACNTIVPIMHETSEERIKEVEYQGESPDEQALVYAAASYGYVLTERTSGHVIVYVQGEKQRLEVLGLHEFDSERKRMSVIVRTSDKKFKLLVKGADSSVINVVDKEFHAKLRETKGCADDMVSATQSHLQEYSSQGLRTLVLASKELTSADYERWHRKYEEASNSLTGRQRKLRDIASAMECNLKLLGATGIEDKLQNGVPETIEALRQAGVKVWVLTGDKQETAISIGISCKLIASNMEQIIINGKNKEDCQELIKEAKATYRIQRQLRNSAFPQRRRTMSYCIGDRVEAISMSNLSRPPLALIIDGTSLVHILENDLEDELYDLATECEVVLCCRVAPLQKAGIVSLIKKRTPDMTLAIGDGANDVSMIQMADVGVGISGQEGRQAVMASDFAMGQFRFLERLLLVHGHWNYNRMSYMILYNFYRNALYVFVLFWYVLHTAFTATTAITDWSGVLYSIIYTSLPTIVVGIMDQDLSDKTLTRWPKLYAYGQREEGYNGCLFWLTMLDTLWQSLVIGFVAYFTYRHSTIDIWSIGNLWTIAIVMLVNLQLAMDVSTWTWLTHVSIWGSIIATWICLLIIDVIPVLPNYWTFFHVITRASYWLDLILILCLALLPRFLIKFVRQRFWPSDIQIFCEREISERNSGRSAVELTQIRSTA